MDLLDKFDSIIELRKSLPFEKADPFTVVMEKVLSQTKAVIDGRETVLAGTNNYMGMTFNENALNAAKQAIDDFGTGTTGSRVLNGTYSSHKELESVLADFYNMDHCMVFSTGYQANLGMISTLAGKDDYIIIDADSHASIYDGCALGNAQIVRFKHNDLDSLEKRLKRLPEDAGKLVVVEGIYSMIGDTAPLKEMLEISKKYGCTTLVDEAHSMGFCGPNGRGIMEIEGVEHLTDFVVGTFSKSVGTVGGFCTSNHPKMDILRSACRPYIFTASLPPSVIASAIAAIQTIKAEPWRAEKLWENAHALHKGLLDAGFDMATEKAESPIIAVKLDDILMATRFWETLLNNGVYVNMAIPPATPSGINLMRVSISAVHSSEEIQEIVNAFVKTARDLQMQL
ncbi:aminotransferase class I/II-fold pyridoxal phosphate-dependent enzyme [Temperatibacter marinus]|uniref:Aminotransferase class I/II-fold pyridoxal phosphate-dependent enzyme n=1 Tax=Temperatibacter marinus TaxID=1456591 RepID=A0AA52EFK1_9PROT|nr:aminotransferase class I/II-fold pyridoxal phosphate-dependent enzyme [Temperatibacter marinus]WND01915.1 aminotransferase class I/II-fold pyridoxal phosphate-dependent enzyme [Temperatibacter marinus]